MDGQQSGDVIQRVCPPIYCMDKVDLPNNYFIV